MKETLYQVLKSKRFYKNILAFNPKTQEYVYIRNNQEIWREKSDSKLFEYTTNNQLLDIDELEKFDIYKKYSKSCEAL